MKILDIKCKCGSDELVVRENGPHLEIRCKICTKGHIKFADSVERAEIERIQRIDQNISSPGPGGLPAYRDETEIDVLRDIRVLLEKLVEMHKR